MNPIIPCPRCQGSGKVDEAAFTDPKVTVKRTCRVCHGNGTLADPRGLFEQLNDLLAELARRDDTGEAPDDIFNLIASDDSTMTEFWETGSVTVGVGNKRFVLTLNVVEAT